MPSWILGPIDHRSEVWNTYPAQRTVVEASAEWEAREKVAETTPETALPNPWMDPVLTSCEQIEAPDVLAPMPQRPGVSSGRGREPEFHSMGSVDKKPRPGPGRVRFGCDARQRARG
jgi:hypothetical protein